jgi:hypothetical protein
MVQQKTTEIKGFSFCKIEFLESGHSVDEKVDFGQFI